jgi:hypothetical protein
VAKKEEPTKQIRAIEITSHKPSWRKGNGTRRGLFAPLHPEKYDGDLSNITYRSKIELRMMKYLDDHPSIVKWSSEETVIPYLKPTTGRIHRYYVDMKVTRRLKDGTERTALVEIKWSTSVAPPKLPKSSKKTRRYLKECTDYAINSAKWDAAKKYCEAKGWDWFIVTEKSLS